MSHPTNAEKYLAFIQAVLAGDVSAMRGMVDEGNFRFTMPRRATMTFAEYVDFMAALRHSAPDFGQRTTVQGMIEQGDLLAMRYFMQFTFGGAQPSHVEYTGVDWVVFDADGMITAVSTHFDLGENHLQAFGVELPV